MTKRTVLAAIAGLALVLCGCSDDSNGDAGFDAGRRDAGPPPDSGLDAGTDAGPTPVFEVRLANNVPGHEGLEVCIWISTDTTGPIPLTKEWLTETLMAIPFRGVTPYVERPFAEGLDFVVALYEVDPLRAAGACPDDPADTSVVTPVVLETLTSDQFAEDVNYTALVTGFAPDTLGASGGALPSLCGAAFDSVCDQETQIVVVTDDETLPIASMGRYRVSNGVPNLPGFTVCYDPDLAPHPDMAMAAAGFCVEPPGAMEDAQMLADGVAYGEITDYQDRAPILPTHASMIFGGGLYLVPGPPGTACPPFAFIPAASQRCYPILAAFPTPLGSDNIQPKLEDQEIGTLFISGAAGVMGADALVYSPAFFIWQDNYVAP